MNKYRFFLAGLCLTVSPLLAFSFFANEVKFQLKAVEKELRPGQEFLGVLQAEIAEGWHLYSMKSYPEDVIAPQPTTIVVTENSVFSLSGPVRQPNPRVYYDENFQLETEYFEGWVDFELPLGVNRDSTPGRHVLPVQIRFMACNDRVCLPPQTVQVSTEVRVVPVQAAAARPPKEVVATGALAGPGEAKESNTGQLSVPEIQPLDLVEEKPAPPEPSGQGVELPAEIPQGTFAYLWFAMAMGGLALLTPCVFPMIPITVSYFTKREVSRKQALLDAFLYSFGIVLTFTAIGFLLAALFGAGGLNRIAASPLINLVIASIFALFALSLFGVVEIRLPSSWLSAVDKKSSSVGGPVGILLMALTFSLTSFTCTVPFVGTVMVAATQEGSWLWSLLGVTAFAAVFSSPFFVLALFPSWLKSLPRSGAWMDSVKITMGFLELAAALKFVSNVDLVYQWELLTRPVFITVWLAIAVMTTLYLLGVFRFAHEIAVQAVSAGRVLAATFFLAVSMFLLRGLFGFPLGELDAFLPPRDYGGTESFALGDTSRPGTTGEEKWLTDYRAALRIAAVENRAVFVDFTGYTCTNCRWMEANIFVRERVRRLFREMILVRLYTDGGESEHEENLRLERERFGTIALPFYAILSPGDEVLATFPGLTRNEGEFISFLEKGLRAFDAEPGRNLELKRTTEGP